MNIWELIDSVKQSGGTTVMVLKTVWPDAGYAFAFSGILTDATDGYLVSQAGGIENLPTIGLTADVIKAFIDQHPNLAWDGYLGLWRDDNGNWSVDVTSYYTSKPLALAMAVQNNQRAVFAVGSGEVVYV